MVRQRGPGYDTDDSVVVIYPVMDTLADLPVIPDHARALLFLDGPLPARSPVWRPRDLRGLMECIPKAGSADHANNEELLSTTDGGDLRAQEKLVRTTQACLNAPSGTR